MTRLAWTKAKAVSKLILLISFEFTYCGKRHILHSCIPNSGVVCMAPELTGLIIMPILCPGIPGPALVGSSIAVWTNSHHYFYTVNAQTYCVADTCPPIGSFCLVWGSPLYSVCGGEASSQGTLIGLGVKIGSRLCHLGCRCYGVLRGSSIQKVKVLEGQCQCSGRWVPCDLWPP